MAINNNNNKNNNTGSYNKKLDQSMPIVYEYISDLKKGHQLAVALF